ncbi:MAG: tRNA (cytidine(34)-2'-O)-methyltransferase [Deltaproteobacteria bacterium]|nr:tRNA (cytidine(34)-2'-O)-methyltransferase [Deltaproteobacteria bacterium]
MNHEQAARPSGRSRITDPPLNIVLVEPEIPPNTGNVGRLCAATGCHLILVGRLGFRLDDSSLKRAGLDYWEFLSWEHVPDAEGFLGSLPAGRFHLFSTHARVPYTRLSARRGDYLLFGRETKGLPRDLMDRHRDQCYNIPIFEPGVRSLNLSNAVSIVLYNTLNGIQPFE